MDQFLQSPTPIESTVLMLIERVQDLESSIARLEKDKGTLYERIVLQEAMSTVFDRYMMKLCKSFDLHYTHIL